MFDPAENCTCGCACPAGRCQLPPPGRGFLATRASDVLRRIPSLKASGTEVGIVIATLSPSLSAKLEPGAPTPRQRLGTLARLSAEGVPVGLEICPVLPGITDRLATLQALIQAAARCGAVWVRAYGLRLPEAAKPSFFRFLSSERRSLLHRYRLRYRDTAEPPQWWEEGLLAMVAELRIHAGLLSRPPVSGPRGQLALPFAVAESGLEYAGRVARPAGSGVFPDREPLLSAR